MLARRLTPILNVSDIQQSFVWFEKLGWKKGWSGAPRPTSGASALASARFSCARTPRAHALECSRDACEAPRRTRLQNQPRARRGRGVTRGRLRTGAG